MKYTVIIGKDVSKTARSPQVWNAWYADKGESTKMIPIDVNSKLEFQEKLYKLEGDQNCLGGAIAVPCKACAAKYTKAPIPAVNCIYRGKNGKFLGVNTDGIAGAKLIEKNITENQALLVLGFGVTYQAIHSNLPESITQRTTIFERNPNSPSHASLNYINDFIRKIGIFTVFNATTMGGPIAPQGMPVSDTSVFLMKQHGLSKWIDINNEQNPDSKIKNICDNLKIPFVNGNEMNLMQAQIAFDLVNK
jgi:shikimate 5-dehydrogenase